MSELFSNNKKPTKNYTAADIEVLEGLEPVRLRPGMYIGGTDSTALHHLISEVLDNSMDEVVAGFAERIDVIMHKDHTITIKDDGRGIPVDNHPKYPDKSALEIILTKLHSGGKFSGKSYQTSGGLHGVGISVVNALTDYMKVEVFRSKSHYFQTYSKGIPTTQLEKKMGSLAQQGTSITFHPDKIIFGDINFKPKQVYNLVKSKAYLFKNVEIHWSCAVELLAKDSEIPQQDIIKFPNGLKDYLSSRLEDNAMIVKNIFAGDYSIDDNGTRIEWVVGFSNAENFIQSYCNTIPTIEGGTHEQGFRNALFKAVKTYGELSNNKKVQIITIEDILQASSVVLSLFINEPQFQGQTKQKLVSIGATKIVEQFVRDYFENWLTANKLIAEQIIEHFIFIAEERLSRKNDRNINRKTVVHKLKLPGKLVDCSQENAAGTELFLVEGDGAGGSAKKARISKTQAILPIKGKILNVANSNFDKIRLNQQINDIETALACGTGDKYLEENLRYEKIVIMTDADVDGAHIASLLMTYFFIKMPKLIANGHLYLAKPPLYRINQGSNIYYALNESDKEVLVKTLAKKSKTKIEIGRFKGLGEMNSEQLRETTMNPVKRTLINISLNNLDDIKKIVDDLMGNKPERRYNFICEQALNNMSNIKDKLDI